MSDESPGPGWTRGLDGRWYQDVEPPPPPRLPLGQGARDPATSGPVQRPPGAQPRQRKRSFRAAIVLVGLIVIVAAVVGLVATSHSDNSATGTAGDSSSIVDSVLSAVSCPTPTQCMAVGEHNTRGPTGYVGEQTLIERWDGSSWTLVPSPNPATGNSALTGVSCTSSSFCLAVGTDLERPAGYSQIVEQWNGRSWSLGDPATPGVGWAGLNDVSCASASLCIASGKFLSQNGHGLATLQEQWNGESWVVVPSPNAPQSADVILGGSGLTAVDCRQSSLCMALGFSEAAESVQLTLAEQRIGTSWTIVNSDSPSTGNNEINAVTCTGTNACFAVGNSNADAFSFNGFSTLIERWTGTSWSLSPSPNTSDSNNLLQGVSCGDASRCFAVGSHGSNRSKALIEEWDGSAWVIMASPNVGDPLDGFVRLNGVDCVSPSLCFAVGDYPDSSGYLQTLVERWNGSSWSAVPSPEATD